MVAFFNTMAFADDEARCVQDGKQMQMNFCARDDFDASEKEMNDLYDKKMDYLQTQKNKDRLSNSQEAWITYRDKACFYEAGPSEESGSIWPMEQFSCLAQLNNQRIQTLKKYAKCTDNGCPL